MTKYARIPLLVVGTLWALLLAACGGSSATATPAPPAAEATIPPTATAAEAPAATETPAEAPGAASASQTAGIIVAVNAEFKPFIFMDENGNLAGFDVDLMNALSAAGNFEVGYENRSFEGMIDAVAAGEYDAAISAITITDARREKVDFTAPYFQPGQAPVSYFSSGQGLGVRTDETAITGKESLTSGVIVGVKRSTTGDEYASTLDGITVVRFDEAPQALDALVAGEVDAVVVDIAVITDYIKQSQGPEGAPVKLVGGPVTEEEYGIVVNKERANVREMLDAALAQIREDGTYDQIFAKWFGSP
jgi:ABC-type amino acid transport substrate-binding protein